MHQRAARGRGVGGSGMRSITRNRYSSGQVMKSAARDGDSADGGSPATPKPAPEPVPAP